MSDKLTEQFSDYINFTYTSFDRVILRGYITNLFVEGSVIKLLMNLGFKNHSNGVLKLLTDQLNSHIKKVAEKMAIEIHWWGKEEKEKYHSKIDFIKEHYKKQLNKKSTSSKVIGIIKSVENTRTFANKVITTKAGNKHTQMYSCNKFVSLYYIYIQDEILGLCYLKIASYMPFPCEFYINGHNYLAQQFDRQGLQYTMKDNSYTKVENLLVLEGNSIKCYNKSGCLLRVETTINKPDLPGLKLKKPACNLQAYYWYGHACNSRYLTTLADIDTNSLETEDFQKYS